MLNAMIGKKLNMSARFDAEGRRVAVTMVSAVSNVLAKIKTSDKDQYQAVQLGLGNEKKPTKQDLGNYKSLIGVPKTIREFKVEDVEGLDVGKQIDASAFEPGDVVRVIGTSKGKGFAGGMKRHGFHGGPATHGQSDRARAPGSSGQTTTPGRVYKGKKMAGHMGVERVSIPNVTVIETDKENNLLVLSGSIPGPRNGILLIEKVGHIEGFEKKGAEETEESKTEGVKTEDNKNEAEMTAEVQSDSKIPQEIKEENKGEENAQS